MFNNIIKKFKNKVGDISASTVPNLQQLNNIKQVNTYSQEHNIITDLKENEFERLCGEGIYYFKLFAQNPEQTENLADACEKFTDAVEIKKSKPAPYFYLSYIAYLCKDISLANKYLRIVQIIAPDFPNIEVLRDLISSFNLNTENKSKLQKVLPDYNPPKIIASNKFVSSIRRLA